MKIIKKITGVCLIVFGFLGFIGSLIGSPADFSTATLSLLFATIGIYLLVSKKKDKQLSDIANTSNSGDEPQPAVDPFALSDKKQKHTDHSIKKECTMPLHIENVKDTHNKNAQAKSAANPIFNRSWEEQDKKFQFHQKYYGTIQSLENNIYSSNDQLIESRIISIRAFNSLQRFCYSKGKAGKLYFDDMWLHCHNSKNSCFSFKDSIKNQLENLFAKYDQLPEVYSDDYHYFKAQRVADLKEILKENDLPVSGKKEELVNRLIENNIKPAIDGDTQKKVEENKELILQNKAYIKENKPLILYYLREPDIPENVFQNSFNQLKKAWGFTPPYNDVLWGALEQLKLQAMETGDTALYAKAIEDEIDILETEGKHDQAQELQKQLSQLGKF